MVAGQVIWGEQALRIALSLAQLRFALMRQKGGCRRQRAAKALKAARANGAYNRHLARLLRVDLHILDDFGLQPLPPSAVQDLYQIISERYETGSILITSNRAFEEWAQIFDDDLLASAALDRLTHHAHTLVIQGPSYRQLSRRKEALASAKS